MSTILSAKLQASLAAYPVNEDGETFIDQFVDCVRHDELDNLVALLQYVVDQALIPALSEELRSFGGPALAAHGVLNEYYAEYGTAVAAFEAAHPVPVFGTDADDADADADTKPDTYTRPDTEMADAEMAEKSETAPTPTPPPVVGSVPKLGVDLARLVRIVATTRACSGFTPLHAAAANNHLPLLEILLVPCLQLPGDLNNSTTSLEDGGTPLHWACLNGHLEIVKALVAGGANVGLKDNEGKSPLGLAEMMGRERVVNWIVANCEVGNEDDVMADAMDAKLAVSSSSSS
ncbi:ankyrin repeat-containing domain protein [Chytriomyces sp. MP71]|nr:ankyrin repeat-containing domain protein [Chytriomyces sp. MP71]